MRSAVVDASVAAKWVIDEVHTEQALGVLLKYELTAPALVHAETASALAKAVRRREMTAEQAVFKMLALVGLELEIVPDESLCVAAVALAVRLDHSVYDCFYLALAAAEEVPLITADRELVSGARDAGLGEQILWIGDIG